MKKQLLYTFGLVVALVMGACSPSYESVENDPLNARIYTLDNGLKVYMTVNKAEPRIQTYIAVRAGGKNDPAETTGLAHYFEHLMFKGTKQFGTIDYEQEKPFLDEIEHLFEVYRTKTDEAERKAIYHQIDSLSYEASKLFIPNEYDKLMSTIGASGTNAYTGFDMTVYVEDIPSNQVENWAKIQSDRFMNSVIRGFHTELETIYEEKNMSLTNDARKVYEAMLSELFPHHPYGQQTVLGTQEHLKNPSITNIKQFYATYYVPNNMAICLSGDFNPDQMIRIIKRYFGAMKPNPNLPKLEFESEKPLEAPVVRDVYGLNAENVTLAWRFPGQNSPEFDLLWLIDMILANGKAGLLDVDLNMRQKVLTSYSGVYDMADYSALLMQAYPKQGQSLDQVVALLKEEVAKLKAGDFDDSLLEASLNNYRLNTIAELRSNEHRADRFVQAFINGVEWADEVKRLDRLSKITKDDVVAFANQWLTDGYALIYKHQGEDSNEKKIAKPSITPILTNRDTMSVFLSQVQESKVAPIEPVFVDFSQELTHAKALSDIPVLYKHNPDDELFSLVYYFDMGSYHNRLLGMAFDYLDYLGTSTHQAEEIQAAFYQLACHFNVSVGGEQTSIRLSGLNDCFDKALALVEELLADPQVNQSAFDNLIADIKKSRENAKLNQSVIFSRLRSYLSYGPESPATNVLSNDELDKLTPNDLIAIIKSMTSYQHRVMYYGPLTQREMLAKLNAMHKVPTTLLNYPSSKDFTLVKTESPRVFLAQYDAKQLYITSLMNEYKPFDWGLEPQRSLYNEYFGSGMNSIVFQEMREARGLAYSAGAGYQHLGRSDRPYQLITIIATQNDKMKDAIDAFNDILDNMPQSEAAFRLAKDGLDARLRTERIIREQILDYYLRMERLGIDYDSRQSLFENLQKMTLSDVVAFQEANVKGKARHYGILGDKNDIDLKQLAQYGDITELSLETLFGY